MDKNLEDLIRSLEREIETNKHLLGFVGSIEKYFERKDEFLIETSLLDTVLEVKNKYFIKLNIAKNTNKAFLLMNKKLIDFHRTKYGGFKFVSGPNLDEDPQPPRILIMAFLFLVFLSGAVIYSILNNWWIKNDD